MKIEITSNIDRVIARMNRFTNGRGLNKVAAAAINATRSRVRRKTVGDVARHTGHTKLAISRRTKMYGKSKHYNLSNVLIAIGTKPLAVHTLSKSIRKDAKGARVGKKVYPGTFPGLIPKSKTVAVWRRLGASRLPIEIVKVPFGEGVEAVAKRAVKDAFPPEFKKQWRKRWRKRQRKLLKLR